MKFFYFRCNFQPLYQPWPKWANFYKNQVHKVNLPKLGKCFTTIIGQSDWTWHCYWLSCLTYA